MKKKIYLLCHLAVFKALFVFNEREGGCLPPSQVTATCILLPKWRNSEIGHLGTSLFVLTINGCSNVFMARHYLTMYPPQAVRQIILAVHRLVTGSDVTEVAGFLHSIGRRDGLEWEQAVVAVNFCWNTCQTAAVSGNRQQQSQVIDSSGVR